MFCKYEALVSDPQTVVSKALAFVREDPLDDEEVSKILKIVDIKPLDRLKGFDFYDRAFFKELEEITDGRLKRLQLPSFKAEI